MDNKQHKYLEISYRLYDVTDGGSNLIEEAPAEQPFVFISDTDMALPAFEEQVWALEKDAIFEFTLNQEDAYGPRIEEHVLDLDREIFVINGHFDHDNVYPDAIVPLSDASGNRLMGRVLSVGEDKVRMDLNHPLAGMTLRFEGRVLESRDATEEEIKHILHHSCNCGHDHCHHEGCDHDDCDHEHDGCGCGHCH